MSINTHIVGRDYLFIDSVHSTNEELALQSNNKNLSEGTVLRTGYQTGGKGQFENKWESSENQNLLLSILLKPLFLKIENVFYLNIAISLAVKDTVDYFFPNQVKIKWCNDIILNDKKVAGILIENSIIGNSISKSIVGIGLNILQQEFKCSQLATSFSIQNKEMQLDLEMIYCKLIYNIEIRYIELKSGWLVKQKNEYIESLFKINEPSEFEVDEKKFIGKIIGIDNSGKLLIESNDVIKSYLKGQIKMKY